MKNTLLRCALYPRVSTEEQHISGLSLPAQKQALQEYAECMGYQIVGVYADEGISARKPVSKRPALLRLLEDVRQDRIDIILVTKLDRWFRNIKEYQLTQEVLNRHNCYWKTIFEDYDTSTANGQMIVNIMLAVAQNEADRTSERIKAVFSYKESIGEVKTGMCAPYGYRIIQKQIQKDPDTAPIVNEAYAHYFRCYSVRKVYTHLQERYGTAAPSFNKVDRLFKNEKYCGRWHGNLQYCEPYITPEQFEQIRSVKNSRTFSLSGEAYIFSGLIVCPLCGRHYTGSKNSHTLKDGSVSRRKQYRCMPKYSTPSDHRGGTPIVTEKYVENWMLDHVIGQLHEELLRAEKTTQKSRTRTEASKASVRTELDRLNLMYQKGRISEAYYDAQYSALSRQLEDHDIGIIATESSTPPKKIFSGNWKSVYEELDAEHRNAFWKSIITEIRLDMRTRKISSFQFRI
ncbi:MAG: recombinase family protein [Lachnospiraceae bacterium]|jgi:site-specific DNA recombinase|nr:recombinase family protein [Lachnospiraceae bacterium]MCI9601540.1 recombinase family protein [Lachnospiraceae bacterium]